MKTIAWLVILTIFTTHTVAASEYGVECLNHKGKFSACTVNTDNDHLLITYKDKKTQDLNIDIPGKNIKALSAGEYARRRVGESIAGAILLAPVFLFALFSKKKMDHIGIEYVLDPKDKTASLKATLIEIKMKYAMALKTDLKALSGKEIVEEEPKK